jgi:hypothetical protein
MRSLACPGRFSRRTPVLGMALLMALFVPVFYLLALYKRLEREGRVPSGCG